MITNGFYGLHCAMITNDFYELYRARSMINKTCAMITDDFYVLYKARAMITYDFYGVYRARAMITDESSVMASRWSLRPACGAPMPCTSAGMILVYSKIDQA